MPLDLLEKTKQFLGISGANEFVISTEMALRDRVASPFYGYFFISWLLVNWRIIYSAFFIDQGVLLQRTGLLRNDYLEILIPRPYSWEYALEFFFGPLALSILALWIFPFGTRIFYRKYLENKKHLLLIELDVLKEKKSAENLLIQEETRALKSELEKSTIEKEVAETNPEILWEQEFQQLKLNTVEFWKLDRLRDKAYSDNGYIYNNDRKDFAYFHAAETFHLS
jgi:hypothetical protein